MPNLNTLVQDIYNFVGGSHGLSDLDASNMGTDIARAVSTSLSTQPRRGLRLSGLKPQCPKQLWHSVNTPELGEPIPGYARIKFAYGHIIEHMLIGLIKASGHEVTGEQDELSVDGITGHRDCVVDGAVFDIKSSSSRGFQKFKDKTLAESDDFGYLDQLDGYLVGSLDDPLVRVKDKAHILAMDKTLGHLVVYEHRIREKSIRDRIRAYKAIVALPSPPRCECRTVAVGESGNIGLDVAASYSSFKRCCFPKLRTFLYARGPVYLTTVMKTPTYKGFPIPELTNNLLLH